MDSGFRRKGLMGKELNYCHRGIAEGDIRDLRRQAVSGMVARKRANPAGAGGRGYFHSAGAE